MKNNNVIEVPYAEAVYGEEEIQAVVDVLKNPKHIVAGHKVKEFEKQIAGWFGKEYGVMVNSCSSANKIALEVLDIQEGSEVITPALTFSTTVAPLLQKKLVPVFVDVVPGTYVVNLENVEEMISDKTRVLMIPSLIGNLPDMVRLREIADKYNLIFIEDSADTLGAKFAGEPSGVYSHISTTSFYASHIITAAGGGGMVCFHDAGLDQRARVLSNWGRMSTLFGYHEASEDFEKRSKGQLDGDVYDAKFLFTEMGYNMQASELEGAFGLEQLKRLKSFTALRQQAFSRIFNFFRDFEDWFQLPVQDPRLETNWLAFPLTIKEGAPFGRLEITKYLEEHKIQTRPIFTGNILKQPAFKNLKDKRIRDGGYPVTDAVMKRGFVVGAHHGLKKEQIDYLEEVLSTFLSQYC